MLNLQFVCKIKVVFRVQGGERTPQNHKALKHTERKEACRGCIWSQLRFSIRFKLLNCKTLPRFNYYRASRLCFKSKYKKQTHLDKLYFHGFYIQFFKEGCNLTVNMEIHWHVFFLTSTLKHTNTHTHTHKHAVMDPCLSTSLYKQTQTQKHSFTILTRLPALSQNAPEVSAGETSNRANKRPHSAC